MKNTVKTMALAFSLLFLSCQEKKEKEIIKGKKPTIERKQPKEVAYTFQKSADWLKTEGSNSNAMDIVLALNRVDLANLKKLDSIVVPTDASGDLAFYMPFPLEVSNLDEVKKAILFSYTTQAFATYEYGTLRQVGPTSMGSKIHKTPTGLFFTNWKAEETNSTFNDEWLLKWNFNIENELGVGFHEYELPGYPASHSCLRLLEKDAKILYEFADQWELADANTVKLKGTPVIVFGSYDFEVKKPWNAVKENPKAMNISEDELNAIIAPHVQTIFQEQDKITD